MQMRLPYNVGQAGFSDDTVPTQIPAQPCEGRDPTAHGLTDTTVTLWENVKEMSPWEPLRILKLYC